MVVAVPVTLPDGVPETLLEKENALPMRDFIEADAPPSLECVEPFK